MIVSDNGSNMIKAIRLLQEQVMNSEECVDESSDADDNKENFVNTDADDDENHLPAKVHYRRMPCMAHTQLVIKKACLQHYDRVLQKTRHLVKKVRNSSEAVEKLINKCGKVVVLDNSANGTAHTMCAFVCWR